MTNQQIYNNLQRIPTQQQSKLNDFVCPECRKHLKIDLDNHDEIKLLYENKVTGKSASAKEEVTIIQYLDRPAFEGQRPSKVEIPIYCSCEDDAGENPIFTLKADIKNIELIRLNDC